MNEIMVKKLVEKYPTPMYVFDINRLNERIKLLSTILTDKIKICYAMKANPFIISSLKSQVTCFEVCSPGELRICQKEQIAPKQLVVSGVYKTPEVIDELIGSHLSVRAYTVESLNQFSLLEQCAKKHQQITPMLIRLTSGNQFGLDKEEVLQLLQETKSNPYIEVFGIQYFSGTQKYSLKKLTKEVKFLEEFLNEITDQTGIKIHNLEFGPGLPVTYFKEDNFNESNHLVEFSKLLQTINYPATITLELGRSIAASCGYYLTKVVDTKTNNNQNYAIVDGGINHLVYYGQSMAMKHPLMDIYPARNKQNEINWNICGALCTVNDILVKQLPISNLQIGDLLVFRQTGAYCMMEGISLFLSRDLPMIIRVNPDNSFICIRDSVRTDLLIRAIQ